MKFPSLFVLLILIFVAKICAHKVDLVTFSSSLNDANDSFVVNRTTRHLHVLNLNTTHVNKTVSISLHTNTSHLNGDWDEVSCPIMFSLTQSRSTRSWALPLMNEKTEKAKSPFRSYTSEFTVCFEQDYIASHVYGSDNDNNIELLVFVSTCNPSNVNYTLRFTAQQSSFIIDINETTPVVQVTPTIMHFYRFNFPTDVDRVAVEVQSEDKICMTAAVQSPWCRLLNENTLSSRDNAGTVLSFNAFWQDMSTRAVIPVTKADFSEGFFIAFMVHADDERCNSYKGVSANSWTPVQAVRWPEPQRIKKINVTVLPELSTSNFTMPALFPLQYVLVVVAITTVTYCAFHCISIRRIAAFRVEVEDDTEPLTNHDELANNVENGGVNHNKNGWMGETGRSSLKSLFSNPTNHDADGLGPKSYPFMEGNRNQYEGLEPLETERQSGAAGPSHDPHSTQKQDTRVNRPAAVSSTNKEFPEDSESEGDEAFSPQPQKEDDDDVIENLYANTVQHVSARIGSATRSTGTFSHSNESSADEYNGAWLKMDAFIRKRKVKKSLDRVYLLIGAIGIFYGLPTVQLLFTYHKISESTGQTDLCYRNYLCSHRIYSWDDFNHIYSNIVYVFLSIVFCIFVRVYDKKVQRLEAAWQEHVNDERDIGQGVCHQFGVFYGLGLAFGLEGILSGLYHVCPTQINFQFDTSFMFILAALSTIKIYQFRHPNPICPHNTFGLLALISFISVGGIILGSKIYEAIFIFLHVVMIIILSVYWYYVGYIRDDDNNPITDSELFKKSKVFKKLRNDPFVLFKPDHGSRLTFLLPLIVFNLAISISQMLGKNPFPTYLVYIFAGNMMLYFLYYCVMKVYHGEAFNIQFIQPFIYLIFSFTLGSLGILYFLDKKYDGDLSPAESRALNGPCLIEGFYDSHDVWHFLSAGSMFFFFMTLLTLDDGIIQKHRHEIVAF